MSHNGGFGMLLSARDTFLTGLLYSIYQSYIHSGDGAENSKFLNALSRLQQKDDSLHCTLGSAIQSNDSHLSVWKQVYERLTATSESSRSPSDHGLRSIFSLLRTDLEPQYLMLQNITNNRQVPMSHEILTSQLHLPASQWILDWLQSLPSETLAEGYESALLEHCEETLAYVTALPGHPTLEGISVFELARMTAAIASALTLYVDSKPDLLTTSSPSTSVTTEEGLLLVSLGLSGIQSFIYTISSKGALKSLRARSVYLELLLENLADELLSNLGLTRANLLYSGGGHAYLLLPNTAVAREHCRLAFERVHSGLLRTFGTRLFLINGVTPCSMEVLLNQTSDSDQYSLLFKELLASRSEKKLRRYSAADIIALNHSDKHDGERECMICGASDQLLEDTIADEAVSVCHACASFSNISNVLIKPGAMLIVTKSQVGEQATGLPLFTGKSPGMSLQAVASHEIAAFLKKNPRVRMYTKDPLQINYPLTHRIRLGDYAFMIEEQLATFEMLAEASTGIKRIGVLRADIDNLGSYFTDGFSSQGAHTANLLRTSALSRSLSLFFKNTINELLEKPEFRLTSSPTSSRRKVVLVYSGGDDLFLAGAWDEVLEAALDLAKALRHYTGGALTISAGMTLFETKYPLSMMAEETAELEKMAKKYTRDGQSKNAISLFGLETVDNNLQDLHTYDWQTLRDKVLGEKLQAIRDLAICHASENSSSFLNNIYMLLKNGNERMNLARLAYLLARMEPTAHASREIKNRYIDVSRTIYQWSLNLEERRQLVTALLVQLYITRKKQKEEER